MNGSVMKMAIKRIVDDSFWTDGKVDDFSPEDKYFMLYLLTNPFTRQLGIYEISIKQAAFQMGYSEDAFNVLLDRFETKYDMIRFSKETNEIAIINFLRHSVMKGGKPVEDCIRQDMSHVKNKKLIDFVFSRICKKDDLNLTVKKVIDEYITENDIHNDNDNDNDNDRTVDVSYNDSYNDSYTIRKNAYDYAEIQPTRKRFIPPTIEEVKAYCQERKNNVDAERFADYYNSNGWMVGKNKMKDWKAAVRTWERNNFNQPETKDKNDGWCFEKPGNDLDFIK